MIVVPVKEGENIERALKKFKRKFEKTGVVKELRARQQFDKPSVKNRLKRERAVYVQKLCKLLHFFTAEAVDDAGFARISLYELYYLLLCIHFWPHLIVEVLPVER
jgi:small subunit ribosomal protein S21